MKRNELCVLKLPEEKTFISEKNFSFFFNIRKRFCEAECSCEVDTDEKTENCEFIYYQKPDSLNY